MYCRHKRQVTLTFTCPRKTRVLRQHSSLQCSELFFYLDFYCWRIYLEISYELCDSIKVIWESYGCYTTRFSFPHRCSVMHEACEGKCIFKQYEHWGKVYIFKTQNRKWQLGIFPSRFSRSRRDWNTHIDSRVMMTVIKTEIGNCLFITQNRPKSN